MHKCIGIIFITFVSNVVAFEKAKDLFNDLVVKEELITKSKVDSFADKVGAAKFPELSTQSNRDRWTAAAIAAREAGVSKPQGQVDVMQSIYNRIESGSYNCKSVSECVNSEGEYEPTFENPWAWKSITDLHSAAKASDLSAEYIKQVDTNLQNLRLQQEAARFIKCRTDFNGESQKPYMEVHSGDVTRGQGHNFFGNFWPNSGNGRCF